MKNKVLMRVLSVFLCICVFCGSFSLTAFATSYSDPRHRLSQWLVDDFLTELPYAGFVPGADLCHPYELAFENKTKFLALLRKHALKNGLDYDTAFLFFCHLEDPYDDNFSSKYGDYAQAVYNGMHNYLVCILDHTPYTMDKDTLATLITDSNAKAPQFSADGKVQIPAKDFKEHITETNTLYFPKNTAGKMSYRVDERFQNRLESAANKTLKYEEIPCFVGDRWGFSSIGGGNEMYFILFQTLGSNTYYGKFQFHFTVSTEDIWSEDRDEVDHTDYFLNYEYWDMIDGSQDKATQGTLSLGTDQYFSLYFANGKINAETFSSYEKYISFSRTTFRPLDISGFNIMFSSDLSSSVNLDINHTSSTYALHDDKCSYNGVCDIGYLSSLTPISTIYTIDTSKIPDNYYITINGDTVYDYSITNPETGQTSTINEYVTNNYTYITNNGSEGGSGGVGGNVTVGGQIDVSGSVGVDINVSIPDINININGNGGGSGGSSPGQSYDIPDTDIFNSYYDQALDESSGFRSFLSSFFSFLPPEILILLGIGLTFVILARILGR